MSGIANITPMIPADRQVIDSYAPGYFRVANTVYEHPVIVFPDRTVAWAARDPAALTVADFEPIRSAEPKVEVVLLGTGATGALLPSKLRAALKEAGLSVDVMASGPACRTYNVLLSEGRRVAAALFPI